MDLNPSPPAHLSAELLLGPVTGSLRRGLEKASHAVLPIVCFCGGGRERERARGGGWVGGWIVQIKINRSETGLLWTPTS